MRPDLEPLRSAHARLVALSAGWGDAELARPSLLPGWSVGHVLAHLARNAEGFTSLCEGAAVGELRPQYPGGAEQRDRDIEDWSRRPAVELLPDLAEQCGRLDEALGAVADWSAPVRTAGGEVPIARIPVLRLREVEMHTSDLGRPEATWQDWSDTMVDQVLGGLAPDRRRHLLAFLAGRAEAPPGLFA